MARSKSKRARTRSPARLTNFLGLLGTSAELPGHNRVPSTTELEALDKLIESINEVPKITPQQELWTDDVQVDCALAAATFVTAGAAAAGGNTPVAGALSLIAVQALKDAFKGANTDCKSSCGIDLLDKMASLDANVLKGAANSISLSGLLAARSVLVQAVAQRGKIVK